MYVWEALCIQLCDKLLDITKYKSVYVFQIFYQLQI